MEIRGMEKRDYRIKEDEEVVEIDEALEVLRRYSDQYIQFLRNYKPHTVFQQTERNEILNLLKRMEKSVNDIEEALMHAVYIKQREESRPKEHVLQIGTTLEN